MHTMILGNVAYRGSLRRRSVVTTAGNLTRTVSKPPSISRVTVRPSSVFSSLDANVAYKKKWQHPGMLNKIQMFVSKRDCWTFWHSCAFATPPLF